MTITQRLEAATTKAEEASTIMEAVAKGDASTEVSVPGGVIPSLLRWFATLDARTVGALDDVLAALAGKQDKHANLTALAGLTGATDRVGYFTGAGAMALATFTSFGRSMLAAANSSEGRTALALGTAATANITTAANDVTAGRVIKVGDYGLPSDALYKALPTATAIDATTDLNAITKAGWFGALLGGAAGSRNTNHPDGQTALAANNGVVNYYWLFVSTYGANVFQWALPYISGANTTLATPKFRMLGGGTWTPWFSIQNSGNQFALGPNLVTALAALGLADAVHEAPDDGLSYMRRGKSWVAGGGGVMPVNNLGTVTVPEAGVSVGIDVAAHEFSHMSIATSGFGGVLTVNFTNIPDTTNGYFVWYVQFLRGGSRTVNFTLPAGTLRWAGGVAPSMSSAAGTRDVIMFERQVGSQNVTATHIAQGLI